MPTWTLTSPDGNQSSVDVADYKADGKGVVLGFATNGNGATETYHLAPEGKAGQLPGLLTGGLGMLANLGGGAGGFKLAEELVSKINTEGKFQLGGGEAKITELAGGVLGAFLAHSAEQSATKLYEGREIEKGDYYNSAGSKVFSGPVRVSNDGTQLA